MDELSKKQKEQLGDNPRVVGQKQLFDAPEFVVNPTVKLPDWVKCKKCGKGPTGYDWLKPVNPEPDCREFLHLSCIDKDLPRQFENMMGGRSGWPG